MRLQDAHAWVEIKFNGHGWVPFDPTPRPDSPWALDPGYAGASRSLQQVLRGQFKDFVIDAPAAAAGAIASIFSGRGQQAGAALLAATALVLAFVALAMARRLIKSRRARRDGYSMLEGLDRLEIRRVYSKALRVLARKGYPRRQDHESPDDYMERLLSLGLPIPEEFRQMSRQAAHALYDPLPLLRIPEHDGKRGLRALRGMTKLT